MSSKDPLSNETDLVEALEQGNFQISFAPSVWARDIANMSGADISKLELWAEALEQGHFQQTWNKLVGIKPATGHICFCALGVAIAVAENNGCQGVRVREDLGAIEVQQGFTLEDNSSAWRRYNGATLPAVVRHWYGLTDGAPDIDGVSIVMLNDVQRRDFPQIAARLRNALKARAAAQATTTTEGDAS